MLMASGNNADKDDDGDGVVDPLTQLGADLDGTPREVFGTVSLSSDGMTMAVGGFAADYQRGVVRVYNWSASNSAWLQIGADIRGVQSGEASGYSLALSDDGTRLAIGAGRNDNGNGVDAGEVRVFQWDGTTWGLLGDSIIGDAAGDNFGAHVDLSADGGILAVTGPSNDSNGENSGHAKVFSWDPVASAWRQIGESIKGEGIEDKMGSWNVSLSASGLTIAVGAWRNDGAGEDSGHTRVFDWDGLHWTQRGSDIDGAAAGDRSGTSVSINSAGTILAIGAPFNDAINENSGHVRVYEWSETSLLWVQKGQDIEGEAAVCEADKDYTDTDGDGVVDSCGDESGWSSSLSGDGLVLAVGAWKNDGNGDQSGHTRIYAWRDQTLRWEQVGADLDGESPGDQSGWKTALSRNGSVLAVGAWGNADGGYQAGHVRVFDIAKDGDAFPLDFSETEDTDFDGIGNNADAFPSDASESVDTDGDGIGNNADADDDGDGLLDVLELANGTDPLQSDSDNDGVDDPLDLYPTDPAYNSMKIEDALAQIVDDNLGACIESLSAGTQVSEIEQIECNSVIASLSGLENFTSINTLILDRFGL